LTGFFVFTMDQGIGGHYYSLDAISRTFENFKVVIIGYSEPRIDFENAFFIDLKTNGIYQAIQKAKDQVSDCSIYHCFDEHSYFFARIISLIQQVPVVLTKCGGKPLRYYPKATTTVFSVEDVEHFSRNNRKVELIPNRIGVLELKQKLPNEIQKEKITSIVNDRLCIMCIARIGSRYRAKIESSLEFCAMMNKDQETCLIIIGSIESPEIIADLKLMASDLGLDKSVSFFTDKNITKDASQYLSLCDLAIGTGRGAMEAMILGKITLCPIATSKLPVLVDQQTFEELFRTNFSGRSSIIENEACSKKNIMHSLSHDSNVRRFYRTITKTYFDVEGAKDKYQRIYKSARKESIFSFFDIVANGLYLKYIQRQKLK